MTPVEVADLVFGFASAFCAGTAIAKWKDRDAARNWLLLSIALALCVIRWHVAHGPSMSVEVNR